MAEVQKSRWLPLVVLALAVAAGSGYWYFRDYFAPPEAVTLSLDRCDLQQQACRRALPGGGEMEFSIRPRPIPLVSPLKLRLKVAGVEVDRAEVDFSGVTMNMGYNRPRLQAVGEGLFEGEGFLPVCIRQRMDWEAKVLLYLPDKVLAVPYRFETLKK
jgi:hypothetical protein